MSSVGKIISLLEDIEKDLKICMRCGMCQSVCPLYRETRLETDVARGKLAILCGLKKAFFEKPNRAAERLNRCLLCGSCQLQCSSGVKSMEIFLKARAILFEYSKLSRLKKFMLRKILSVPNRFHKVLDLLTLFQKVALNEVNPVTDISYSRIRFPLISKRHLVPLAQVPFHERPLLPHYPPSDASIKVAVFVGCLIDRVFPSIAESMLKVFNRLCAEIYLPDGQACCGVPALSHGDLLAFKALIEKNVELFTRKEYDLLVTACATCAMVIKNLWPAMIGVEKTNLLKKVYAISSKTIDVTAFIARYGLEQNSDSTEKSSSLKVTYHDPCHLRKSLGVWREPRKVLNSLKGYQFVEMIGADSCCGFGGSFGLEYEDLSTKIGLSKIHHFIESGADIIATACPACMIQFSDLLSRMKIAKPVKHVVELYADAQAPTK